MIYFLCRNDSNYFVARKSKDATFADTIIIERMRSYVIAVMVIWSAAARHKGSSQEHGQTKTYLLCAHIMSIGG